MCNNESADDKSRTEFLSNLSHEIRTPLNVIIGMCEIARFHIDDKSKVEHCLKRISDAGELLTDLVNNVMDITKIEQGKQILKESTINIEDLTSEIRELLTPLAEKKSLVFDISCDDIINKTIKSDHARLIQIAVNLGSNAIKYTPPGGFVKIYIKEISNDVKGMITYNFVCKDNGIGISKEFMKQMYKPFTRSDAAKSSHAEGVGLGMSIVQRIVIALGGSIDVKSDIGVGTTVSVKISFPVADGAKAIEDIEAFKRRRVEEIKGRKIVLIAEDMNINAEILKTYLADLGYEADVAESGEAVVDMFQASEVGYYKLILMDIGMPMLDGYGATLMIRGLNRPDSKLPIVAMTANVFSRDRDRAVEAGMNDYLTKPLKMEQLERILNEYVVS